MFQTVFRGEWEENTKFEEYELSELDAALKSFYAGASKSDAVKVDLKRKGYTKVDHYPDISEEDLQKLYSGDTPVFDVNIPYGLQFKVWFELMLFLCRRSLENFRTMTKDIFRVKNDASGMKYVYQNKDELDKNHRANTDPSDSVTEGRMYEKKGDLKCPVASFENYISKLCPDLEDLWQRPKASFDVGESTWYCKSPLGKITLASMMSEISHIALLFMTYTNHSIRATSITVMDVGD
ncbi:KCTD1_15 [Mytilus coruscus]|uniref:KCTD1_15 n=1 Tax=Mytilus coruscus TaxID=42192 RepID=A0A6J8D795_MYTCO|nr:KCTD1_15 [Mytilus coruscus]